MDQSGAADASIEVGGRKIQGSFPAAGVANFLGIPYGRISKRFTQSHLVDFEASDTNLDATSYGPHCPQPDNLAKKSRAHLYHGIQPASQPRASELGCLTLNIYTPAWRSKPTDSKLPVVIWIHGGGFVCGDGNWEYNGTALIEHSIKQSKPFILVGINYRLGYLGFLSSRELRAEAEDNGEEYVPNQGLYDQRLALQWVSSVQNYIHYFGGDASNVTVAGQSAGAWAALAHVLAKESLCSRGWIMSPMSFSQHTEQESQAVFDKLVESCGVPTSASGAEKIRRLRDISQEQMSNLLAGSMLVTPTWDSTWFFQQRDQIRIEHITKCPSWIRGLVIGTTKDETAFLINRWKTCSAEKLSGMFFSAMKTASAPLDLARGYGIIPSKPQDQVLKSVINFTTDAFFRLMPFYFGQLDIPVSVYRFDQTDALAAKDWSYHCLDTPHLFRLPAVAAVDAPESMRMTSNVMSEAIMEFVYEHQPWITFGESHRTMVFDGNRSGLADLSNDGPWKDCVTTREEEDSFVKTGLTFLIS